MTKEINAYYGGSKTPCTLFVIDNAYCVEGGTNINFTRQTDLLIDGVWIEELSDYDCSQPQQPIWTLEEMEEYLDEN